ncbi:MAG TPA: bifunctional lysylphosphatidylglycerol flippase/synthetase MprF [Steroidobacteraceae bacterium]|jgi:phosphatidylglycerol lysyltransferase|nr:bifunctional lysylphosphatidylglycerol flippase/synthetase MprF [Steroidobacteraceae bacterium]
MDTARTAEEIRELWRRWLLPTVTLVIFVLVGFGLRHELAEFRFSNVLASLKSISRDALAGAVLCTAVSYGLLGFYDVLALRYLNKVVSYGRTLFTSFIAYAFGHNFGIAAFTGAAVRYRLYSSAGLSAADVAAVSAFCGVTTAIGLGVLAGLSFIADPHSGSHAVHMNHNIVFGLGIVLLLLVVLYGVWSILGPEAIEVHGWRLRAPTPQIALPQIALAVIDLAISALVLWLLLPRGSNVSLLVFAGAYSTAMTAAVVSHVPGGLGVFESLLVLALPGVPADQLLGSLLAWRAVYYLLPLLAATVLFGGQELKAQHSTFARIEQLAAAYISPIVPQVTGALVFVAGFSLLVTGATPSIDRRLTVLRDVLPLVVLEASHLASSVIGLALLILSRALFRRLAAAYQLTLWLLAAGMLAALLRGLEIEQMLILALVMAILRLGRRAFYRPAEIMAQRFTPVWIVSLAIVISTAVWIGFFAYRHVDYSHSLWWTFAFEADAPRMLRASLLVVLLAAAFLAANLLRPARPEPGVASQEDLSRARALICGCSQAQANAALSGDKRLLFSAAGDAFLMYQIHGRSWVALGDPVGERSGQEELVWRFRELSDLHGGWTVFYQVSADQLPLYIDAGLTVMKLGEEARVQLTDFSLEGSARAELRTQRRRAERDGASFRVLAPDELTSMLPKLRAISDAWLEDKAAAEKSFSVGAFDEDYISHFPVAVVTCANEPVAFASLWVSGDREEIAVDLMRFGADAPRGAMDFLFVELMLWGRAQGHHWLNLGMAPLAGLERHPLAPAWHRVGNFVFRYGEHFYNFDGLRRYKAKFTPLWESKYLASPGGLALPRILLDISVLISGGVKELFAK